MENISSLFSISLNGLCPIKHSAKNYFSFEPENIKDFFGLFGKYTIICNYFQSINHLVFLKQKCQHFAGDLMLFFFSSYMS